jgi:hypothetical protein
MQVRDEIIQKECMFALHKIRVMLNDTGVFISLSTLSSPSHSSPSPTSLPPTSRNPEGLQRVRGRQVDQTVGRQESGVRVLAAVVAVGLGQGETLMAITTVGGGGRRRSPRARYGLGGATCLRPRRRALAIPYHAAEGRRLAERREEEKDVKKKLGVERA